MILQTLDAALQKTPTVEATDEAGHLDLAGDSVRMRSLHGQGALGQYVVEKGLLIENDELLPARQEGNDGRIGLVGHHAHELLGEAGFRRLGGGITCIILFVMIMIMILFVALSGLGRDENLRKCELGGWTGSGYLLSVARGS